MFFFIICALQPEWGDDSLLEEYESPLWFHKDDAIKTYMHIKFGNVVISHYHRKQYFKIHQILFWTKTVFSYCCIVFTSRRNSKQQSK